MQEISKRLRAVIIGGSGGIGAALARGMARRSVPMLLHGRSNEKLEALRAELSSKALVEILPEALSREMALGDFVDRLEAHCEAATHYFHALGPFLEKPLGETSPEDWDDTLFFNLKVPALCAARVAVRMAERFNAGGPGGVIVLFGGTKTDTIRSYKTNAAYGAAKTGLVVFAKSLAREFAGRGVSVLTVCPGIVDTEYVPEAKKNTWKTMMPGQKPTAVEDFAEAVLDLAFSDHAELLSGSVMNLDGGMRL